MFSIRAGAKYLCIFQELNKSLLRSKSSNAFGCAVVKTNWSVLRFSSGLIQPQFPKKTKQDGVLWEQRVAAGSWHAFLKRLRE